MPKELPPEFQDLPALLTTTEVAKLLNMTRASISNLLNHGKLEGFQVGGAWRIHRADFLKKVGFTENPNRD